MVIPLLMIGGAAMAALAWPVARIAGGFGQAGSQGIAPIAHALAMFGFGLAGYGLAFVMTRILFSLGDVRRAAILVSCSAVAGVVAMFVATRVFAETERAAALALGYGITQTISALLLTWRVRVTTGSPRWRPTGKVTTAAVLAASVAGVVMLVVQAPFGSGRTASLAAIVTAGSVGVVVFGAIVAALTGIRPAALLRLGRGAS
jgi:peptidoglycan biosynthesis protein MviN/MurJ (putative lipid II flippase)